MIPAMDSIARTAKQIGAALRRRRRSIPLSQAKLGRRTGLRQATISALENGEQGVELRTLVNVTTALGLEVVIRERPKASENIEDVF